MNKFRVRSETDLSRRPVGECLTAILILSAHLFGCDEGGNLFTQAENLETQGKMNDAAMAYDLVCLKSPRSDYCSDATDRARRIREEAAAEQIRERETHEKYLLSQPYRDCAAKPSGWESMTTFEKQRFAENAIKQNRGKDVTIWGKVVDVGRLPGYTFEGALLRESSGGLTAHIGFRNNFETKDIADKVLALRKDQEVVVHGKVEYCLARSTIEIDPTVSVETFSEHRSLCVRETPNQQNQLLDSSSIGFSQDLSASFVLAAEACSNEDNSDACARMRTLFERAVESRKRPLSLCYQQSIRRGDFSDELRVRIDFSVAISPDGAVSEVAVEPEAFKNTRLARCLASQIKGWRFPSFSGETIEVKMPFIFDKKSY